MENILLLVAACCLAAAVFLGYRLVKSPAWKQRQLRKASQMAARGEIKKMIDYLEVNRDKKSVECPLTNALIYFFIRSGDLDRAEKVVMAAIGAGDKSGASLAQMGYIAQQRGDAETAEKFYRESMEKDPAQRGTMKVNLAGLFITAGERLDEAERLLEEALEHREGAGKSGVYLNLAMLHMKRKDYSRAKVSAMTSAELLPDTPIAKVARAQALGIAASCSAKMGDSSEASRLAGKALKVIDGQPGTEKLQEEFRAIVAGKHAKK